MVMSLVSAETVTVSLNAPMSSVISARATLLARSTIPVCSAFLKLGVTTSTR